MMEEAANSKNEYRGFFAVRKGKEYEKDWFYRCRNHGKIHGT